MSRYRGPVLLSPNHLLDRFDCGDDAPVLTISGGSEIAARKAVRSRCAGRRSDGGATVPQYRTPERSRLSLRVAPTLGVLERDIGSLDLA